MGDGPEFVAKDVRAWIEALLGRSAMQIACRAVVGAKTAFIESGSPWENGYVESFNARFRPFRQFALQSPAGQWTNY